MVQGRGRVFGDGLPGCVARGLELKKHIFELCFKQRVVPFPFILSILPCPSAHHVTFLCRYRAEPETPCGPIKLSVLRHDPPETFAVLAYAT
ncbi:unnamed protein product [Fusarium venenatum]|uniref:Uncharacterized protein n=1 Tax=Fusarium venenatum TaxID=56646 RepID=A0A2L2TGE8_9HYPO|nr:uncharacterized protein FVRRES_10119 [Fusarium venenatum]CEI70042.1 unnamed protein product [Fusarium venenatum]